MIWFEELTNRKKISRIFNSYSVTFTEEERRSKEQFLSLAEHPDVYILNIKNDQTPIGYCILWQLDECCFLEHFEVFQEFRNQSFGSEILNELKEKYENIVLETEPEHLNDVANRRIAFYQRNHFKIIEKKYLQPSYGEGKPEVPLYLMANFTPEDLKNLKTEIFDKVY